MKADKKLSTITRAMRYRIDDKLVFPVVTPLYQNSAFSAESPYFYTRKNNPNCEELERVLAIIEGAKHVISVTTGMAAISLVTSLLKPKQHLVINKLIYGCSYKFFQRFSEHNDVKLTILDLTEKGEVEKIPQDLDMILFETPTNPFLKTVNIASIVQRTKKNNPDALVVVDNTWATSLFQKPLSLGADICVYSATKFISGHSDVMGGLISTDSEKLNTKLREERFYNGMILDPHSAWLLRRSMNTFEIRMKQHSVVAKEMCRYLKEMPQITKVFFPEIDGDQLVDYGCILFCSLRKDLIESYKDLTNALELFDTGTGMACVTSMVAQPYSGSHASMTDDEKEEMGLGKDLIRLCFGLEDIDDLKNDLKIALEEIEKRKNK